MKIILNHSRILVLLAWCLLSFSCNNGIELVDGGKSDYRIVLGKGASEHQYKTAEELQFYLYDIGGERINIVEGEPQVEGKYSIFLTGESGKDLGEHEIYIKTLNKNLYISGGSDKALRNAVYEFLERFLGCRWYAPGVEKVPSVKTVQLPNIDYRYTPDITTRTVHSRLFYDNHDFADKQKVTYESFPDYVPQARVHTFHRFMPEDKFYKTNPEFYALRGDKRLPTQLCLTNPEVLAIVKDSVASLFARYPGKNVLSVSQDDNQQHCQCENCSAIDTEEGSASGTMIRFVNEIANYFPEKTISTLAYQYTRRPCKTKPLENVLITLCSIECDRSAPIAEKCTEFADDLRGWGKLTDNIRIWDYTTQFTNFLAPFPNLNTLRPNIHLFRDNNAQCVFEQHSNHPSELFELRSYVTAQLLWNPDRELEELITDFTDGYYGEAGVYIKKYIDKIHS
ncbi:MAG: DUF4838 domain-containing protein, partial [Arenibacter sp.]|nr:DUF4838 domain-containing protein [Arenibacter sp.]